MTPRLWALSVVVGVAPGLNNLSLKLNSVGYYTVVKLMVTPVICILEYVYEGKVVTQARAAALFAIATGVGIASINDLELKPHGAAVAAIWLPVAAVYKVLWSRSEKEDSWTTMPLMMKILPWSMLWMALLTPFVDPPGVLEYPWQLSSALLILASGLAAFCVNFSGFLVLGQCRPLTHVVLGQLKSGVVILGGFFFFGRPQPARSLVGSAIAVAGSGLYAYAP